MGNDAVRLKASKARDVARAQAAYERETRLIDEARAEGERAGRAKAFEEAADLVDERWNWGQAFIVNALLVKAGKEPE